MPRAASVKKIGERLAQALKRKGATTQQAMESVGGRTLPTWYRWIGGDQEGGCRDIPMLGLFVGLTPDQLLLDDTSEAAAESILTPADEAGMASMRLMLGEMNALTNSADPEERPVAALGNHVHDMLKMLKTKRRGKR